MEALISIEGQKQVLSCYIKLRLNYLSSTIITNSLCIKGGRKKKERKSRRTLLLNCLHQFSGILSDVEMVPQVLLVLQVWALPFPTNPPIERKPWYIRWGRVSILCWCSWIKDTATSFCLESSNVVPMLIMFPIYLSFLRQSFKIS